MLCLTKSVKLISAERPEAILFNYSIFSYEFYTFNANEWKIYFHSKHGKCLFWVNIRSVSRGKGLKLFTFAFEMWWIQVWCRSKIQCCQISNWCSVHMCAKSVNDSRYALVKFLIKFPLFCSRLSSLSSPYQWIFNAAFVLASTIVEAKKKNK